MRMKEVEREREEFSLFSVSAVVNAAGQTRKSRFFPKMSMDRRLWEMPVCVGADLTQFL